MASKKAAQALSTAEIQRRLDAVRDSIASVTIEGGHVTPEAAAMMDAWADGKITATYNARVESLGNFWRNEFVRTHAVFLIDAFYENVARHDMERRVLRPDEKPENVVLRFEPKPPHAMAVACLYARWKGRDGEELLSFAAITNDPPPEVAAAGHDPLRRQHKAAERRGVADAQRPRRRPATGNTGRHRAALL